MSVDICNRDALTEAPRPARRRAQKESDVFGRIGNLETRLARTPGEDRCRTGGSLPRVRRGNAGAELPAEAMRRKRDVDAYDAFCDHLLVLDRSIEGDSEDQIVGTYRLLRQDVAMANGGFYSASEFDIDALIARHPDKRFMELGRSCVLPDYRTKRIVELLWQGNWAYALKHGMSAMFGCASFPGIHPESHALALSFLHHNIAAKDEWAVDALPHLARDMDLMPVRPSIRSGR
jgi:putative hemolysin